MASRQTPILSSHGSVCDSADECLDWQHSHSINIAGKDDIAGHTALIIEVACLNFRLGRAGPGGTGPPARPPAFPLPAPVSA